MMLYSFNNLPPVSTDTQCRRRPPMHACVRACHWGCVEHTFAFELAWRQTGRSHVASQQHHQHQSKAPRDSSSTRNSTSTSTSTSNCSYDAKSIVTHNPPSRPATVSHTAPGYAVYEANWRRSPTGGIGAHPHSPTRTCRTDQPSTTNNQQQQ